MSKIEKLVAKITNNPKAVRFDDLDKVMRRYGFERFQASGGTSHYVYAKGDKVVIVVKPHGGKTMVGRHYVEECLTALDGEALDGQDGDEVGESDEG